MINCYKNVNFLYKTCTPKKNICNTTNCPCETKQVFHRLPGKSEIAATSYFTKALRTASQQKQCYKNMRMQFKRKSGVTDITPLCVTGLYRLLVTT